VGFAKAATQLGVQESQLYYWKNKLRQQQTSSEREQRLADEDTQAFAGRASRGVEHRKKGCGVLCQTPEVKYAFMLTHKSEFYISAMCRALNVSRSSFYHWLNRSNKRHLRQLT